MYLLNLQITNGYVFQACLIDISNGIELNHIEDFKLKFPNITWDSAQRFLSDINRLSRKKNEVQNTTIKVLGSRTQASSYFPQQPDSGSVPSRRDLQTASAARKVTEAPRQVQHQVDTTQRQFNLPAASVSHTKPELAQIAARDQRKLAEREQAIEKGIVDNAISLFKAQTCTGRWYDNLSRENQQIFQAGTQFDQIDFFELYNL